MTRDVIDMVQYKDIKEGERQDERKKPLETQHFVKRKGQKNRRNQKANEGNETMWKGIGYSFRTPWN